MNRISRLSGYVAGGALLLAALVISIDVLLRWQLAMPIKGIFEISELAFACIMSLAFADANFRRAHVSMELAGNITGRTAGVWFVAHLLTAVIFVFFTFFLVSHGTSKSEFGEQTLVLHLPLAPFWYLAAALMAFSALLQIAALFAETKKLASLPPREIIRELAAPLFSLLLFAILAAALIFWHGRMSELLKVLVGFTGLYLLALAHVPIGVAMALAGLAGVYALLGTEPAALVGANNLTGVLASSDIASVPLFLLDGKSRGCRRIRRPYLQGGNIVLWRASAAGMPLRRSSDVPASAPSADRRSQPLPPLVDVAFREMTGRSYAPSLATGTIAAGGTLGALIPPSVILIIYCVLTEQPISVAFMASLIPGLLATALYVVTVIILVRIRPGLVPPPTEATPQRTAILAAWRPALLFLLVVGGLYGGVFTAQEAAAVGTGYSFVFWLFSGRASWTGLPDSHSRSRDYQRDALPSGHRSQHFRRLSQSGQCHQCGIVRYRPGHDTRLVDLTDPRRDVSRAWKRIRYRRSTHYHRSLRRADHRARSITISSGGEL